MARSKKDDRKRQVEHINAEGEVADPRWECSACGAQFETDEGADVHLANFHPEPGQTVAEVEEIAEAPANTADPAAEVPIDED